MRTVLASVLVLLAACSSPPWSSVGGYQVGGERCGATSDANEDARDACRRFETFGRILLDETPHPAVTSAAVYNEPSPTSVERWQFSGAADFAIVAFRLVDGSENAFYIRCGISFSKSTCVDMRPLKPGWGLADKGNPQARMENVP